MDTYIIAADRSALAVSARRVLGGRGTFRRVTGTVSVDENKIPRSLRVSIDARSLRTGIPVRDRHLKTAAFMDAGRYPLITYASERIERGGPDRYTIAGMLRLHGREHPITLDTRLEPADGIESDGDGDGTRCVRFSGTVSSTAFAIPRNPLLRTMVRAMFGDAVAVTGSVCLVPVHDGMEADARSLRGSLSQG